MEVLVWAGMFLTLAVVGSLATIVGIIGMPIGADLQGGLIALSVLVVGTGIVVAVAAPAATQGDA
jgi:uncharacterized membrane protein YccF (DUF307 family)